MTELQFSFTSRDFASIRDELNTLIKETRREDWSDFFQTNLGQVLVEMAGLVGDVLSFGQDQVALELFLATCRRYESAIRFARSVGYSPRLASPASVRVKATTLPLSLSTNGGVFLKGSKIKGSNGLTYELLETYVVQPGDVAVRLDLWEGTSYEEQFEATSARNQTITSGNGVVAEGSWSVYVGDPTDTNNRWTEVDNIQFESSATNTYDTQVDGQGRLVPRFGDGVAGKIPDAAITLVYRTCNGVTGNAPVGAIKGSLQANLTFPGVGTVSVPFENRDIDSSIDGGTSFIGGEIQSNTVASATQSSVIVETPIVAGSLVLTIVLPSGGGTLVLQDNAAGAFTAITNTTGRTLLASAITYSTGAWNYVLSSSVAAGGSQIADYFFIVPSDELSATIVGAAQGGADREGLEELRVNIPAYIRSQDKVITIQDYNDVLVKLAGIALVFADPWINSYTSNAIKVNVWSDEVVTFTSASSSGLIPTVTSPYTRYTQVQQDRVNDVLAYLRPRTILTVQNIVVRPGMLWVDLYLGQVTYDNRRPVDTVRLDVMQAVLRVFSLGTGFVIRLSDIYDAVRSVSGIKHFIIQRAATGTLQGAIELQGVTPLSGQTVSGTLLEPTITPASVRITVETGGVPTVLKDNGGGSLVFVSGTLSLVSGSVNYVTGAWTATFDVATPLIPNQQTYASYDNVTNDYRYDQLVTFDAADDGDTWPPPGTSTAYPVITPPFKDGRPLFGNRPSLAPIAVTGITRAFSAGTVTCTVTTATPHGLAIGQRAQVVGASPAAYNGDRTVISPVGANTLTYAFAAASDPGGITGTIVLVPLTVLAPFASGDRLTYDKLKDIVVEGAQTAVNFYNDTYLYNNEIYYSSVSGVDPNIRAINLRRLVFDLVGE